MTLVLAQGCFDLLHPAHIRHLEEARRMGDYLVVGLTMDAYVGKGAARPIYDEWERREMLQALRCVAAVSMVKDSLQALKMWKPQIFVKGADRKKIGLLPAELAYCKTHRIEIRFTKPNPLHTAAIIERIRKCPAS